MKNLYTLIVLMVGICALIFIVVAKPTKQNTTSMSSEKISTFEAPIMQYEMKNQSALKKKEDSVEITSMRDRKVSEKLKKFIEGTSTFSKESVAQEQMKVTHGLEQAWQKKSKQPVTVKTIDDNGYQWEKTDFGDGIVRFFPSIDIAKSTQIH